MSFISYAQNFKDVLPWHALKDEPPGFYIEVGAWEPDIHSVTRALSERDWRGINVEPTPHSHARLDQARPNDVNLRLALGAQAGETVLHEVIDTALTVPTDTA